MKKRLLLSLFSLVLSGIILGQSIFENPITGTNPNTANPYTTGQTFDMNITVSGIGRGTGISGSNATNRYNATGWNSAAIDLNDYFYFTLTPTPGYKISFSSLDYNAQVSLTGPTQFSVRSSRDAYASDINLPSITNDAAAHAGTVDLSSANFQDLTSPITFRFYGWGASAGGGTFSINDFIFTGATALPIELTAFKAVLLHNKTAELHFTTSLERNNAYFSIERFSDGHNFQSIGQVSGSGDSDIPQNYSFTDKQPLPGKNYYRLKQVDFDGDYSYSNVVSVDLGNTKAIILSPMPTSQELRVSLEAASEEAGIWQVLDMDGRVLRSDVFPAEATECRLNAGDLPDGFYVFRLVLGQEVMARKFRKQD